MDSKQVEVTCPCCETRLTIDLRTSTVLRQVKPSEVDETGKAVLDEGRWDAARDHVRERRGRGEGSFDSSLERERGRERELDDLFDKARRKLERRREELEGEGEGEGERAGDGGG